MANWTRSLCSASLIAALAALWGLVRGYAGLSRDGELYAVQAFSRVQPNLAADLYLQNVSQDRFTAFSPLYAFVIRHLHLQPAELTLYAACMALFLAASWVLARRLMDARRAALSVASLSVIAGYYGAYQVFTYAENYLTARSAAEALVVTALALHVCGWRKCAFAVGGGALSIHPLMALPGLLLLICLSMSRRAATLATVVSVMGVAGLALAAVSQTWLPQQLFVMDPAWLTVVQERSQFLFLQHWTITDWEFAIRPLASLTLTALVICDERARALCFSAMLVSVAGMAVAWIGGSIGPIALIVQGQAWRWAWLAAFISVLFLLPTAIEAWQRGGAGPLCATLAVVGWSFSGVDALLCIDCALALWLVNGRLPVRFDRYAPWTAGMLLAAVLIASVVRMWPAALRVPVALGTLSFYVAEVRTAFGERTIALLAAAAVIHCMRVNRLNYRVAIAVVLLAASSLVIAECFKSPSAAGTTAQIAEFADWRSQIPPDSTVLTLPSSKTAAFIWFTLMRPSYLSVDQSAGVVFSAATAAEVRRRSEVLLPVMKPDWMILSQISAAHDGKRDPVPQRALTAVSLRGICADPQLGFVIAKEDVGFPATKHTQPGPWQNWNLYDCRRVLASSPSA